MQSEREPVLRTERLRIVPLTNEQLAQLRDETRDREMKKAYSEMLEGCEAHPDERLWYTAWRITLRKNEPKPTPPPKPLFKRREKKAAKKAPAPRPLPKKGTLVGDLCFKGPQQNGAVEIGYGIEPACQRWGYATEAAKKMMHWAFRQKDVWVVCAQAEPGNTASQKVLQKLGFVRKGRGSEGLLFEAGRPEPKRTSTGVFIGIAAGICASVVFGHMAICLAVCMLTGMGLGTVSDNRMHKQREAAAAARAAAAEIAQTTKKQK